MKIKSVYISAFGKLKDASFNFKDGLNLIYGENEKGKTTLMTFIKMMFYGCDSRSPDLNINIRKKYIPMSGDVMAGHIVFEQNGNEYKIERTFGATSSTDKIVFTDLSSGERKSISGSKDLGIRLFGLTKSGFENCCYISAAALGVTDQDGVPEINSKLSNLSSSGEEDISGKLAEERLNKLKTFFKKPRATSGLLDSDNLKLSALKEDLITADKNESLRTSLNMRIEAEKAEIKALSEKAEKIKEYLSNAEKSKQRDRLEAFINADKELKVLDNHLSGEDGRMITRKFIADLEKEIAEIKSLNEKLSETETDIISLTAATEELSEIVSDADADTSENLQKEIEALKSKADTLRSLLIQKNGELESISAKITEAENVKPKINPLFACLSAVFGIMAVISVAVLQSIPLTATSVFLFMAFLVLTLLKKDAPKQNISPLYEKRDILYADIKNMNTENADINSRISVLNDDLLRAAKDGGSALLLKSKLKEKAEAEALKAELTAKISAKETAVLQKFAPYKKLEKINQLQIVLLNMKSTVEKQEKAEIRFNMLKADLGNISVGEAKTLSDSLTTVLESEQSFSQGDLEKCNTRLSELNSALAFDIAKARTDFRFVKHPTSVKKEIDELSEKIKREQLYFDAVNTALQTLAKAEGEARKSFGGVLEKRVTEIFAQITDNAYKYVSVSKNMEVSVDSADTFGSIETSLLSQGTADQVYFSLRLALSEFLSDGKENLPLFLDDAFQNFDDKRAAAAFEFLKNYAKNNQVFFFTCHNNFKLSEN